MADLTIYLDNKNYSSWSLRAWLALKRTTVAFDEVVIPLYQPTSRETILKYSPSGRVPAGLSAIARSSRRIQRGIRRSRGSPIP